MANPDPSPSTRFRPGQSGNPSGKSSEQLAAEHKAAAISAELRVRALSCLQEKLDAGEIEAIDLIKGDILKLFKDSEDRAHGTPKATTEHSGPDGGNIPMSVEIGFKSPKNGD